MTPAARLAAVIELLPEIAAARAPVGAVLERYFRQRRYAGSGDRRAISGTVYDLLRRRARLGWHLARHGVEDTPRTRVLADVALQPEANAEGIAALFSGAGHAPAPLDAAEAALARISHEG